MSELDNPVWWAITGSQHELATATSLAARFDPDVSPFGAFSEEPTPDHWGDLARLVGPGGTVALTGAIGRPPAEWRVLMSIPGVQMVGDQVSPDPETPPTMESPPDRPRTAGGGGRSRHAGPGGRGPDPGPSSPARSSSAVTSASADEAGSWPWPVSVCARPGSPRSAPWPRPPTTGNRGSASSWSGPWWRRYSAAARSPFLHASSENTVAVRLYERLGFTLRREVSFLVLEAPG